MFPPQWYQPDPLEQDDPLSSMAMPALPPMPQAPPPPPAWISAIPLLFAGIAKGTGHQAAATGALQGFQQGQLLEDQRRESTIRDQERQYALQIQQQRVTAQNEQIKANAQARIEAAKAAEFKAAVDDLRQQKFPSKQEYDVAMDAREAQLQVRPGTLRRAVPYTGPTAQSRANDAVESLLKVTGPDVLTSGATVQFDRDDDGIPENVPVNELFQIAGRPVAMLEGKPYLPPKDVKPANVQEWDVAFKGAVAKFAAEKGREPNDIELGQIALQTTEEVSKRRKEGTTSVIVPPSPERPLTRYQRFQLERGLRGDADKLVGPVRELNRQVGNMRAGLEQAQRTGKLNAATQAIVNSFNRIMEPGSVTREGEYLRSTGGQALLESLRGRVDAITKGGPGLTLQSLEELVTLAETIADNAAGAIDTPLEMIGGEAREIGLPTDRVVSPRESYRLPKRTVKTADPNLRARARQILQQGGYDTSEASIDKFLANPKNQALLGGGK